MPWELQPQNEYGGVDCDALYHEPADCVQVPDLHKEKRFCKKCGHKLADLNTGDRCYSCQKPEFKTTYGVRKGRYVGGVCPKCGTVVKDATDGKCIACKVQKVNNESPIEKSIDWVCKVCGGNERYKKNKLCVPCQRIRNKIKRDAKRALKKGMIC